MLRRILFILVLFGLGFIVWRLIDPSGAENFVEKVKDAPSSIFSRDKDSDPVEGGTIDDTGTTLEITTEAMPIEDVEALPEDDTSSSNTGQELLDSDQEELFAEEEGLLDDLFAEVEEDLAQETEEDVEVSNNNAMNEEESESTESADVQTDTEPQPDVNTTTAATDEIKDLSDPKVDDKTVADTKDCREAGEIAMSADDTMCCDGLYYIYYRGVKSDDGVICFDPDDGTPQCKYVGTDKEGWYHSNGDLLRKDLDCGEYFGTKYYEVEVKDDATQSILKNLFK